MLELWRALLLESEDLLRECRREAYQGSGPGGQKRNRVRSGIRLIHGTTGMRAENCESREAGKNLAACLHTLRLNMACALGEKAFQAEAGAAAWPEGAMKHFRIEANASKPDYPITAAITLVALARARGRITETAQALPCSGSALTRHWKADKAIWALALRWREALGLHSLK